MLGGLVPADKAVRRSSGHYDQEISISSCRSWRLPAIRLMMFGRLVTGRRMPPHA